MRSRIVVVFVIQRIARYSYFRVYLVRVLLPCIPGSTRLYFYLIKMPFFDSIIRWAESSDLGPKSVFGPNLTTSAVGFSTQILPRRILQYRAGLHFDLYALLFFEMQIICLCSSSMKPSVLFFTFFFLGDSPKGTF